MMWQKNYPDLLFDQPSPGVLLITINRPEKFNATNLALHRQLEDVWQDVHSDPEVRTAVITGAGEAFSAGGDFDMVESVAQNYQRVIEIMGAGRRLVDNLMSCEKPIISAINGPAVGAGLVVALMADVSIMAEEARFTEGHIRMGVATGDHATALWPLLCGLAKARYYLLTSDFVDGKEAERIGLVSLCVPRKQLLDKALEVAAKLSSGPQFAIRMTKRSLNGWLYMARPILEAGLACEGFNFMGADLVEGVTAFKEKRAPRFPSAQGSE